MPRPTDTAAGIALLTIGPLATVTGLEYLPLSSVWNSPGAVVVVWGLSLGVGIFGICLLPIRRLYRTLLIVPYVPFMGYATIAWSIFWAFERYGGVTAQLHR
jgi:ABC-type sugar transport system permease subunit